MHRYERWIARKYLANIMKDKRFVERPRDDAAILLWIAKHHRTLGTGEPTMENGGRTHRTGRGRDLVNAEWRRWRGALFALTGEIAPSPSPLQRRVDWLANACALSDVQRWIIGVFARIAHIAIIRDLAVAAGGIWEWDANALELDDLKSLLSPGMDHKELTEAGDLARLGLIDLRERPRLSITAQRILSQNRLRALAISDMLLGDPASASLRWDDFAHLGALGSIAARIVGATEQRDSFGAPNILFYGPPGTGKSEFAKTLGAHLRFSVHFVGEAIDHDKEPSRRDRVAALIIANSIGVVARRTILVVDEADDLFDSFDGEDSANARSSKVFMNRLVECACAPTIWIVNDVNRLSAAFVRRMNLAVGFSRPGLAARRKMVAELSKTHKIGCDAAMLRLAHFAAPPALLDNSVRTAALIDGGAADAQQILQSSLKALGQRAPVDPPGPLAFDPTLSQADVDLTALTDGVVRSTSTALSFCLSGPPGTGKSAYARHLAERLDLEVLEKRYSSLSSMWLGETEKAIAAAFEEAADLRAFLIVDEADSLLHDRSFARHSWEITQVNEMLTWMERHPYPFACTTNAIDSIDAASMRRFLFKVRFRPMTPRQISDAFQRIFQADAPEATLALENLTPGDFATVLRRAQALDECRVEYFARWLADEVHAKPGGRQRRIGF